MINHWAAMTTTTTGTGSLSLTSISGWPTLDDIAGQSRAFRYDILDDATGAPLASGIGTLSASTTLARGANESTYASGAYTPLGSVMSLAAGTKRVILTAMANDVSPALPTVQGSFGQKLVLPEGLWPSNQTATLTANVVFASCLRWSSARPLSSLACQISTAQGTGSDRLQLGVYACKENGLPGNLICRTGDILPNSTGLKTAVLSGGTIELPPAFYWFAICCSVNPTMFAYDAGSSAKAVLATPMGHTSGSIYERQSHFQTSAISSGWTVLPSTITLSGAYYISGYFAPTVGGIVA